MEVPAIECRDVRKRFGDAEAVAGASFAAPSGRVVALLGPSGCGKTTLLRMIAGFERPDSGEIRVDGRVVVGPGVWEPPERRRIGFVFQDYALFPHLTVGANVAFGIRAGSRAERRERVARMLSLVGLEGKGDRHPHELSGGQQQRVALARAMAPDPRIVLLDEPFSNLDADLRRRVREEVGRILAEAGATAIFVTHDQEEALNLGHLVAVMRKGRILEMESPRDIYLRPRRLETARILGAPNLLPGESFGISVKCALGRLPVAHPCRTGEMQVLVRPESIRIFPCLPGTTVNGATPGAYAVVEDIQFHGNHQHVFVRLEDGTPLRAKAPPEQVLAAGQRVVVRIPDPVVCFTPDGTSRMDASEA